MRSPFLVSLLLGLLLCSSTAAAQKKKAAPRSGPRAVIETSLGTFELQLLPADAPRTVENFTRLAKKKYFDGVTFHRVAKGFVIQGGDPTGTGSGGQSIFGKPFPDEINPGSPLYKVGYKRGIVAMANPGRPHSNGSQFFVLLVDAALPPQYTIFGRVTSGMETVDAIGAVDITPVMGAGDGKPKIDVIMKRVRIR
jgi:cyclophilin family peptidyl-prolyl cis-trans isomerase